MSADGSGRACGRGRFTQKRKPLAKTFNRLKAVLPTSITVRVRYMDAASVSWNDDENFAHIIHRLGYTEKLVITPPSTIMWNANRRDDSFRPKGFFPERGAPVTVHLAAASITKGGLIQACDRPKPGRNLPINIVFQVEENVVLDSAMTVEEAAVEIARLIGKAPERGFIALKNTPFRSGNDRLIDCINYQCDGTCEDLYWIDRDMESEVSENQQMTDWSEESAAAPVHSRMSSSSPPQPAASDRPMGLAVYTPEEYRQRHGSRQGGGSAKVTVSRDRTGAPVRVREEVQYDTRDPRDGSLVKHKEVSDEHVSHVGRTKEHERKVVRQTVDTDGSDSKFEAVVSRAVHSPGVVRTEVSTETKKVHRETEPPRAHVSNQRLRVKIGSDGSRYYVPVNDDRPTDRSSRASNYPSSQRANVSSVWNDS